MSHLLLALFSCLAPSSAEPLPAAGDSAPGPVDTAPDLSADYRTGTAAWLDRGVATADFHTGAALFDQEWLYGTYMMAAMGFGEHALAHPEDRAEDLRRMEMAIDRLLAPEGRTFDAASWGADPITSLGEDRGHAAWLGYTGLALGLHRVLVPDSRYTDLQERVVDAIERRVAAAPGHLVETYPGQWFPVDNAAMIGALGLHTRATGARHPMVDAWVASARARWVQEGLLVQRVHEGVPVDAPRGSGTFLAAWFLHHADPAFAESLYVAGRDHLGGALFGVRAMREYLPGVNGRGDIDSGPIVMGFGVSASGFAIGAALQNGDEETARALAQTARTMAGVILSMDPSLQGPSNTGSASGSHIGDAILFAMTAAGP